jgi:hypothetical protein
MTLGMYFQPEGFTTARYDETIKKLDEAGAGSPDGRIYHFAMETDGKLSVFDVWESMDKFEKFGETLVPIMQALGSDPGQPMTMEIHNIIKG